MIFLPGNIALFKPTAQSSTYVANNQRLISSNAVDGGKKTHYSYCVHTGTTTTTNPWWRVDLGRVEPVAEVYILNRGDCCGTNLDGAEIRVGKCVYNTVQHNTLQYHIVHYNTIRCNTTRHDTKQYNNTNILKYVTSNVNTCETHRRDCQL